MLHASCHLPPPTLICHHFRAKPSLSFVLQQGYLPLFTERQVNKGVSLLTAPKISEADPFLILDTVLQA